MASRALTLGRTAAFVLSLALVTLVGVAACGGSAAQRPSATQTTSAPYGKKAIDGQTRSPGGAATAWTTGGGPASPGVPASGDVVEEPVRTDAGAP